MKPLLRKAKNYFHEFSPLGILDVVVIAAVLVAILWQLHPNLIFSSTLLTGGDTGSHLVWAQYLHAQSNPFNFTPWYPGWYDGMPLFTYYFILPDLFASLLTYVIGFAVAFKLATIVGSLLLPITAYSLGKMFRAPRPIPLGFSNNHNGKSKPCLGALTHEVNIFYHVAHSTQHDGFRAGRVYQCASGSSILTSKTSKLSCLSKLTRMSSGLMLTYLDKTATNSLWRAGK